ncbi:MAG: TonB-dependent receptor, partial [Burkholderiales bacterium]|nr:TonB-dependent receptor [Opitutaceae bacterium]
IRGMNADFNAVSINGIRAGVSDFSGLSRRVPLDVVSAKSADQIEVTKALRPDQDGDGIGGAVNIVTRGPFDRDGVYLSIEGAASYSSLADDYSSDYPYNDTGTEFSASFSSPLGTEGKHGVALSANFRERAFLKQRVGTTGWRTVGGFYRPDAIALQHFYDDVTAKGLTGTYEWRPTEDAKFRVDASFNNRDTERGRQRQVVYYGNVNAGAQNDGTTYTDFDSSTGNSGYSRRVERNVRQFFEEQQIINVSASGEIKEGDWTFTPLLGLNRGTFDGDPERDINARFRTARGTTSYTENGYLPEFSSSVDRQDPDEFFLNSLDRGTSFVTDETYTAGLDAKRDATLFDGEGFWKFGLKSTVFDREYVKVENYFFAPTTDVEGGDVIADYRANSTLNGAYDYGFFIDPDKVRDLANTPGVFTPGDSAFDNAARGLANSYDAEERIHAGYVMGQFTWGKLTALSGARAELTRVNFTGVNADVNDLGDYSAPFTAYDESNDYLDVLPGLHLRYEQTKNLLYRFAVTRSLARPRLSDLAPVDQRDDFDFEIRQGNIDLDPVRSTNFDLGTEYYFDRAGVLSFGLFYKDMRDNIYTARNTVTLPFDDDGDPLTAPVPTDYVAITRANAESAWVGGFEAGYDQQFTFLPAPFDGLGAFVNYTYADSEVDTGLAAFDGVDLPLFNQVENTINAGLFYEKKGFRTRVSMLYRSESLLDIATDGPAGSYDPALSRYLGATTTLDVTASYEFAKGWQVFTEITNLLNEESTAYNGDESRPDYYEITDWTALVGLRWSL